MPATTNMHLEIQNANTDKPVGVIRSSYREEGKIKHKQFGRITGQPLEQLKILQLAFNQKVVPKDDPQAFEIAESKEYGGSLTILSVMKEIELDKAMYSQPKQWVDNISAIIVGRILYAGSKLSLCNQYNNSTVWEQCGVEGRPDIRKHCYESLDRLLERQKGIQKKLAKRHLKKGHLVLYDITNSYLEGQYKKSEKAHVFLCMLAYYVQWHMQKRLEPLFKKNKKGWERRWTFTQVIETLKVITRNRIEVNGISFYRNTVPKEEQKYILDLMGVAT